MTDLANLSEFDHLSHTLATIEKPGGETLLFPIIFVSLLDETDIQHDKLV
jgi:hypothetical protein